MRRGAAAPADASTPAPDPGGANIYSQQLLSREEGGGRPVARGPERLLPIPHRERATVPTPQARLYPPTHTCLGGHLYPQPKPQPGNRPEGWARGNLISGPPGTALGAQTLQNAPFPICCSVGAGKGGWSREPGYSEERDAEGWSWDVRKRGRGGRSGEGSGSLVAEKGQGRAGGRESSEVCPALGPGQRRRRDEVGRLCSDGARCVAHVMWAVAGTGTVATGRGTAARKN